MEDLQNQFQKELAGQRAELEKIIQAKTQAEGEHRATVSRSGGAESLGTRLRVSELTMWTKHTCATFGSQCQVVPMAGWEAPLLPT